MRGITWFLTAVLLVSLCSTLAFGAEAKPADGLEVNKLWGDNVLVTCALAKGQALDKLFSNTLSVQDMVAQWKKNFEAAPPAVAAVKQVKAALDDLQAALSADANITWTAQDMLRKKWKDLPGSSVNKDKIRAAFKALKDAGMMTLAFMTRAEDEDAPAELINAMVQVLNNAHLSVLSHPDLYTKAATPEGYTAEDMDLLSSAMDTVRLIRTDLPNGMQTKSIGCCNKTTRKCVLGSSGACTMCNLTCCLGSTWCP